ncbi:MAG: hypothetical protein HYZ18_05185, partial [Pseudogulbenkiania sp.]|nr:hypothetical protein [Pseudogulbenkiania sp.]
MSIKKNFSKLLATSNKFIAAKKPQDKLDKLSKAVIHDDEQPDHVTSEAAAAGDNGSVVHLAEAATATSDAPSAAAHSVAAQSTEAAASTAATTAASGAAAVGIGSSGWLIGAALVGVTAAASSGGGGGSGTSSGSGTSGGSSTPSTTGTAIDGYLVGAKVYLIDGSDNKIDTGVTTGADGKFTIQNPNGYVIQIEGGTNSDTGLANTMVLKAPGSASGDIVVTPLTTLIQSMVAAYPKLSAADAEEKVQQALGIDGSVDLLRLDPISASNVEVQKAAVQIATLLTVANVAADDQAIILENLATQVAASDNGEINLIEALTSSITSYAPNFDLDLDVLLKEINEASDITAIGTAQSSAITALQEDSIAPEAPSIALKADTTTGEIVVTVTADADATSAKLFADGNNITAKFTSTISEDGLTVTFTPKAGLVEYSAANLTAKVADTVGNQSEASATPLIYSFENVAPAAPSVTLTSDSGSSATDGITSNGAYSVPAETGATVEYSTNGIDWSTAPPSAVEGSNSIQVRAIDAAGNVSDVTTLAFTLDTSADKAATATLMVADTLIGNAEKTAVSFSVVGLDSDASGVATFSDGTNQVTATVAADGSA